MVDPHKQKITHNNLGKYCRIFHIQKGLQIFRVAVPYIGPEDVSVKTSYEFLSDGESALKLAGLLSPAFNLNGLSPVFDGLL